jgi:hypothetical protein
MKKMLLSMLIFLSISRLFAAEVDLRTNYGLIGIRLRDAATTGTYYLIIGDGASTDTTSSVRPDIDGNAAATLRGFPLSGGEYDVTAVSTKDSDGTTITLHREIVKVPDVLGAWSADFVKIAQQNLQETGWNTAQKQAVAEFFRESLFDWLVYRERKNRLDEQFGVSE